MTLKPLGNRVLIKTKTTEVVNKTAGGLFLPEDAASVENKPQTEGEVIAVGTGDKIEVAVGATVLYSKYGAMPVAGEQNMFIVNATEILAIIE